MDAGLEKKMREWIDRNEIWAVMQRYGRGVDRADAELLRSVYWPDAIDDHGTFVGSPEGFIEWVAQIVRPLTFSQHNVLNHSCELDGDDAYCETYYLAISVGPKPPFLMSNGRYVDHLQKRNGEWRIFRRVTVIEGRFDLHDNSVFSSLRPLPGGDERPLSSSDRNDVSYARPVPVRPPTAAG